MRSLNVNIPHHLPRHEAISRIKNLIKGLRHEQKEKISNVKEDWNKETGTIQFSARGFDLSAMVTVHSSSVEINAKVPFAVFLFRNKIKEAIKTRASKLLSNERS